MIKEPKTDPIPAPDPATPTVAAPAPINFAAESISRLAKNKQLDGNNEKGTVAQVNNLHWGHGSRILTENNNN